MRRQTPEEARTTDEVELVLPIEDQRWTLRVAPTPAFVSAQESALPPLVLAAGLLVAALAALSVRYILISRLKSVHLAKSLALNAGIISSSRAPGHRHRSRLPHHDFQPGRRSGPGLPRQ